MTQHHLTSGLVVRPFESEDVDAVFAAVAADRERLGRFMPWVWVSTTRDDTAAFITAAVAGREAGTSLQWAVFDGPRVVGAVGAGVDRLNRSAEAGYWIAADLEGRGIVTEVMRLLISELVGSGVHRVVLRAAVGNQRSRAVAERLGFTLEGVERESLRTRGVVHDAAVYSLLAGEWPPEAG
ncbi:MAG: hypothetical protein A2Z12_06435 [Actinobacteria bacterium RBG_16_68_21]|nr:MAG: hypothetical protein A2Z12_06435 [Actinobacteria bacterium RBG_16_68_21]